MSRARNTPQPHPRHTPDSTPDCTPDTPSGGGPGGCPDRVRIAPRTRSSCYRKWGPFSGSVLGSARVPDRGTHPVLTIQPTWALPGLGVYPPTLPQPTLPDGPGWGSGKGVRSTPARVRSRVLSGQGSDPVPHPNPEPSLGVQFHEFVKFCISAFPRKRLGGEKITTQK